MEEVKDWLANARDDVSRRQFLAGVSAAGAGLAGFAIAWESGEAVYIPVGHRGSGAVVGG